jgi:hypothetical protein
MWMGANQCLLYNHLVLDTVCKQHIWMSSCIDGVQQTSTFECPGENQFCPRFNFRMNTASFRTVLIHCASLHCSNCHKVVTTQRPHTKLPTKKRKIYTLKWKHGKTFEQQNCNEIWHACAAPGMRSNHLFPALQSHETSWSMFFWIWLWLNVGVSHFAEHLSKNIYKQFHSGCVNNMFE